MQFSMSFSNEVVLTSLTVTGCQGAGQTWKLVFYPSSGGSFEVQTDGCTGTDFVFPVPDVRVAAGGTLDVALFSEGAAASDTTGMALTISTWVGLVQA
jgi:hypothetical protein